MAQLKLVNGEIHNVKESKEEIDKIMYHPECLETGIIMLNWLVVLEAFSIDKEDIIKIEPVSFIRANIMMYY